MKASDKLSIAAAITLVAAMAIGSLWLGAPHKSEAVVTGLYWAADARLEGYSELNGKWHTIRQESVSGKKGEERTPEPMAAEAGMKYTESKSYYMSVTTAGGRQRMFAITAQDYESLGIGDSVTVLWNRMGTTRLTGMAKAPRDAAGAASRGTQ